MAQLWLIYQLTHSSVWLGTIGFLNSIPVLFFSMFGGTLADRMSKHKLVMMTQIASSVQALLLAALVIGGWITAELVAVLAFTLGVINAFDIPSRQAFIVDLVGKEDLANAIALNSVTFNAARIIGPAIGGVVMSVAGIGWCFFVNAFSFIAVIFSLSRMNVVETMQRTAAKISVAQSLKESIAYIRSDISMTALLLLVAIVTIFGWSYSVLLPIFADSILNIGAVGLGNLLTATGVGAIISAFMVATYELEVSPRTFLYNGIFIFVISIMMFALSSNVVLSLLSLVGVGMGLVSFFATANASLQRRAPDHLRGRVMGLYSLMFQGIFPFGSFGIGVLAHAIGARYAIVSSAIVCGVSGLVVFYIVKKKNEHHY